MDLASSHADVTFRDAGKLEECQASGIPFVPGPHTSSASLPDPSRSASSTLTLASGVIMFQ